MSIFSFFPSRTVALAITLVPLLARQFDLGKADEWLFEKLPDKLTKDATLAEFQEVLAAGKHFLKACYNFFHK